MREIAVLPPQQDLFPTTVHPAPPATPVPARDPSVRPRPEVLLARVHQLRLEAQNHSRMQREHARAAAALLTEAMRLEEQALQLALPLAPPGPVC